MTASQTPASNDFVRWVEEKSETVMADLGDKFPPATSGTPARSAQVASCPIAAARKVSPAASITE